MFKRLFVATGIFGCILFLLMLPGLIQVFSALYDDASIAFYFAMIRVPSATMVAGILVLLLLATLSFWLSGKLVKTA